MSGGDRGGREGQGGHDHLADPVKSSRGGLLLGSRDGAGGAAAILHGQGAQVSQGGIPWSGFGKFVPYDYNTLHITARLSGYDPDEEEDEFDELQEKAAHPEQLVSTRPKTYADIRI